MCIAYSVVTKYAFRNCASNVAYQVLPGYPHSSAGTYDDGYWSRMQTIFKLFNEWVWLGSRVYYCGCKCTWFQHYRQDPVRNENMLHWEQADAKHLRLKLPHPMCVCVILLFAPTSRLLWSLVVSLFVHVVITMAENETLKEGVRGLMYRWKHMHRDTYLKSSQSCGPLTSCSSILFSLEFWLCHWGSIWHHLLWILQA